MQEELGARAPGRGSVRVWNKLVEPGPKDGSHSGIHPSRDSIGPAGRPCHHRLRPEQLGQPKRLGQQPIGDVYLSSDGDFNVVGLVWNTGVTISSIVDTKGNTYTLAVGPTTGGAGISAIYCAKNIAAAAAGGNTVTVTYSAATTAPDLRVAEYSGISTTSPLDVSAVASGTGTNSDSGSVTTTNANDLLIGSNVVSTTTTGPGTGFTKRVISGFDGNILEDKIVTATGTYNATAPLSPSGSWTMQLAAFKGASSGGDTQAPTAPTGLQVSGTPGSTQVNLQWTASTDNVGVTGYLVERCQGSGCSTFTQDGSATSGTTLSDPGLTPATSYSYRVRATDAAGNLSSYSSTVTTTTAAAIGYVQSSSASPNNSSVTSLSTTFTATAQTVGNFIVAAVSWGSTTASVSSITDSKGNVYSLAVGPTKHAQGDRPSPYSKRMAGAGPNANVRGFVGAHKGCRFIGIVASVPGAASASLSGSPTAVRRCASHK